MPPATAVVGSALFGDHGIGTTDPGKSGTFRKTAEFDRHLPGPVNFKDRFWQGRVADKGLIGGVKEDQRLVFPGIVDPGFQLRGSDCRAGWVVGVAEIDQVNLFGGESRDEAIFPGTLEIDDTLVAAVGKNPGTAGHDVGVKIDRVDRIGDGNADILAEQFLDIAGIALRAVTDKDLIGGDIGASYLKVGCDDCLAEEKIALLWSVTTESGVLAHLCHRALEGVNHCRAEPHGDIADAEFDHIHRRVVLLEDADPSGDIGKEIRGL